MAPTFQGKFSVKGESHRFILSFIYNQVFAGSLDISPWYTHTHTHTHTHTIANTHKNKENWVKYALLPVRNEILRTQSIMIMGHSYQNRDP